MVIHVKEHLSGCSTNEEGEVLLGLVLEELARSGSVTVDFHGVLYVTTSFVNSAFVPLFDRMSFKEIKSSLRVVRAYPQIGDLIRKRMASESQLQKAA